MASQPPSELRLEVAADVLFNGSTRRAPSGLCEVELVLDNEDGRFGGGRPEVSVMRRLRRDGDSTYLLNRLPVRRLDVQEALADAGLGRELHAIVSQGRVEAILMSRPADRRGYIEEAAGLGKYKRRRHRALGKLARVEANLARARDLEAELKARLRPLALQASAAERAAALVGEIDGARIELAGSQIAAARRQRARNAAELERVNAERAALDAAIAGSSADRERIESELAGLVGEQERAAERFWGLANGLDRLASRRDGLAERLALLADDRRRALLRAERLDVEAAAAAEAAATAAAAAEEQAALLAAGEGGADEDELGRLQARAGEALDAALAARRELAELDGRTARARHEVEEATQRAEGAGRRAAQLVDEATRRAAARGALEAELGAADAAVLAVTVRLGEAQAAVQATRATADEARETERIARAARSEAVARAGAARTRVDAAERAAARGDGLGPAVRRLRERGAEVALDLVVVPPGLEAAVAAALGWRAGEAVARVAADAVALLADDDLAGAALLCLDRLAPRPAPERGTPLASLVTLAPGAPAGLLDGIAVVDDAAELAAITRGIAVTRDGRGLDADRGLAFRAGSAGAAVLALRREHDEAAAAAGDATATAGAAEERFAVVAATLVAVEDAERTARAAVQEASRAADEAARRQRDAMRAADAAARDDERAAERLVASREEEERHRERVEAGTAELDQLVARRSETERRHTELAAAHAALEETRAELAERVALSRAVRAAATERVARARADRDRHAATADRAARRAAAARATGESIAAIEGLLPRTIELLGRVRDRVEHLRRPDQELLDSLERRAGELTAAMTAGSERDHDLQRQARELAGRGTALEVEGAHAEERLGDLTRRRREVAERSGIEPIDRVDPLPADEEESLAARIERLERRREQLGAVNPLAQQEYDEARDRHEATAEQIGDLEGSIRELRRLIRDLTATIAERFDATYTEVERNFAEIVETLFPGGKGRLRLVEPEDPDAVTDLEADAEAEGEPEADDEAGTVPRGPAEPGVELEISPAGKQIAKLGILSGGEKALAAIAFLFAIMLARPCPFYVLDEVDAALDDANVERFLTLVERFRDHAQFIVITHQKRTMEAADVLYGVTMAGDGISKVVSRRLPRDTAPDRSLDATPA
jgi:chromosome segregation protein